MKLFLFSALLFIVGCAGSSEDENQLASKIDSLEIEIEALKKANDTLSEHLMQKSYIAKDYPAYFDTIAEPDVFILENLQQDPDLIPKDAVLGGTMRFTAVNFVNDELLLAEYEDGHIMGKAIYSYTINASGEPEFELVGTVE